MKWWPEISRVKPSHSFAGLNSHPPLALHPFVQRRAPGDLEEPCLRPWDGGALDEFALPRLPIAGVVNEHADQGGSILMDRSVFVRHWNDTGVTMFLVDLHPGVAWSNARQAILGIVNSLMVSIVDRRRELGTLRAVGGLRRQVRIGIWMEAMSIGLIGLIAGLVAGGVNLYCTLEMTRRSFAGFHLAYEYPVGLALVLPPTVLAASFLAALWPAQAAVRAPLAEALEYE